MESVGFVFGLVGFIWCVTLSQKVSRLERVMREAGIGNRSKKNLRHLIANNLGKWCKIEFEDTLWDKDMALKKVLLKDVDEDWVLVQLEKNDTEKLIHLSSIKSIQLC